ncbi:MAG: coniferyl aldehyde dehydrogenase [Candidatus Hydrogenedentota bacterium]
MAVVEENTSKPQAPATTEGLMDILEKQRAAFLRDGTPSLEHRKSAIDKLHRIMVEHKQDFVEAISQDFGNRSHHESLMAEVFITINSIKHCKAKVGKWMKPKKAPISIQFKPGRGKVHYQPLGVVGIISPWNYPLQLAIVPVVQALAAGNRVMLKPSELTPATSALLAKTLGENFSDEEVAVTTGGPEVGAEFSGLPFDHLFYTGSTKIGRLVMQAAAKNLVPVTLELGGKSPCIVGEDCNLDRAVPSITSGKLLNAGQTCVAPDYALVPKGKLDGFVAGFEKQAAIMYPSIADNAQYTSIVSDGHYERIQHLLGDARSKGARIVEVNPKDEDVASARKIPPTLVLDVTEDMAIMHEEIFGPVMPVMSYDSLDEAIKYVNDHERPLALYYFGDDGGARDKVINSTTSGGVCINETLFHLAQEELPFGGVGPSGIGSYHGLRGFQTFSHEKSVFYQSRFNSTGMFRAPYGKLFDTVIKVLIGK